MDLKGSIVNKDDAYKVSFLPLRRSLRIDPIKMMYFTGPSLEFISPFIDFHEQSILVVWNESFIFLSFIVYFLH